MKDLVIGSASNLTWEQCEPWVNSLNISGFDGYKVVCLFGNNERLTDKFNESGFIVFNLRELSPSENICVARFDIYLQILNKLDDVRYVIATDVTDVVFQQNPSLFLNKFADEEFIAASSENIKYKDELWGANNLLLSFGPGAFERMKNNTINNAGVMAGSYNIMKELFFAISVMCINRSQHISGGGGPDQAAYNTILQLSPFSKLTKFIGHDEGWACQVGTVADPRKDYSKYNIEPLPVLDNDVVKTSTGVEYFIVHQYNRNPLWNETIKRKYL